MSFVESRPEYLVCFFEKGIPQVSTGLFVCVWTVNSYCTLSMHETNDDNHFGKWFETLRFCDFTLSILYAMVRPQNMQMGISSS